MNRDKWKEYWERLKPKLAFLKPWDMNEDVGDDLEVREMSSTDHQNSWNSKAETPWERTRRKRYAVITMAALVAIVAGCFLYYNGHHSFTECVSSFDVFSANSEYICVLVDIYQPPFKRLTPPVERVAFCNCCYLISRPL